MDLSPKHGIHSSTCKSILLYSCIWLFPLTGLFADYAFQYSEWRREAEPTLAEMTRRALEFLQSRASSKEAKTDRGYYLFVEGGLIDYGHHFNYGAHALFDTLAFDEAIQVLCSAVEWSCVLYKVVCSTKLLCYLNLLQNYRILNFWYNIFISRDEKYSILNLSSLFSLINSFVNSIRRYNSIHKFWKNCLIQCLVNKIFVNYFTSDHIIDGAKYDITRWYNNHRNRGSLPCVYLCRICQTRSEYSWYYIDKIYTLISIDISPIWLKEIIHIIILMKHFIICFIWRI